MRYRIRVKNEELNQLSRNNLSEVADNWQLEIRKVTYDDIGVYQCSLPLVNPQQKNITVKIIRKFHSIPIN
jgi:hypothetical protein